MPSTKQLWKNYIKKLVTKALPIGLSSRPFALVFTAAEFQKTTDLFDGDFIVWADTENIFTRKRVHGPLIAGTAALATAITVVKHTGGDNDFAAKDTIIDQCENVIWQLLHKIQEHSEAGSECCTLIAMLDEDSITIADDGPYFNEHWGSTAQFVVHLHNGIPAPDRNFWAS